MRPPRTATRWTAIGSGVAALVLAATATASASAGPPRTAEHDFGPATLTQFAALPAATFVPASEPSGGALGTEPINGVTPPFVDQPIQGFSGILRNRDGTFDVLSDNGYGAQANSADFVLRIQRIAPDFGTGHLDVVGGINLTDPDHRVPFPLVRADRVLTGADFDPESIIRQGDGSYWIGDEFGPFLLHADRAGRLLTAPIPIPGVYAPENPLRGDTPANLSHSRGLESLARSPDGRTLYPVLEGTVAGDTPGTLRMYEFNVAGARYTGRRWTYRMDEPSHSVPDVIAVDANRYLNLERDDGQGPDAVFKHVYLVDRRVTDADGTLHKTLVADLLNLANPRHVGGFGDPFRFPFFTIEGLVLLTGRSLGVVNDNNYPFSAGRTPGVPDNDEFIVIRLDHDLQPDPRATP
jgi:hypothetical protein